MGMYLQQIILSEKLKINDAMYTTTKSLEFY